MPSKSLRTREELRLLSKPASKPNRGWKRSVQLCSKELRLSKLREK